MKKYIALFIVLFFAAAAYGGGPPGAPPAKSTTIKLDVSAFDGVLSSDDDTIQKAMETFDDYAPGGGDMAAAVWDGDTNGFIDLDAGGTNADMSGYTAGLIGMAAGAVLDIDTEAELEAALGAINVIISTEIDAFSELNALTADKTLVNEEDAATIDQDWTFTTGIILGATGDITQTAAAVDWDLVDNNASALSLDAAGKAGIFNIDTQDGAEGVTMSGTLGVTGALTASGGVVGNASTATALAANGANAGAGNAILGVDASGAAEGSFDVATQAELDAYTGGANIVTVGTIATGTWQGDAIGTTYVGSDLDASNIGASVAFADGDQIDLSGIIYVNAATTNEGLVLPAYVAGSAPADGKSYVTYDAANNAIMVYEAGGWADTSSGAGAATTVNFVTTQAEGSLSTESILDSNSGSTGITVADAGGDGGAITITFDPTELDDIAAWGNNSGATITFDAGGATDPTLAYADGMITLSHLTVTNGINIGTSQAIVGTTAITIGNDGQTIAINSSDWDINATGVGTGFGNFTSDGVFTGTGFTIGLAVITEAELEILDGATLGTADINIIDGISDSGTLTAAELLHVDGVSSAIQPQLDARALESVVGTSLEADDLELNGAVLQLAAEIPHVDANEAISGTWEIQDNVLLNFGNDADIGIRYDTTGVELDVAGTDAAADLVVRLENLDGTYEMNLEVEGDLTVEGVVNSFDLLNAANIHVATTTDAHEFAIQVHNGTGWVDALKFVNDSGAAPYVEIGVKLSGLAALDLADIGDYNVGGSGLFKDEDDMVSNSAGFGATQQSIKAYVDNAVAGDYIEDEAVGAAWNTDTTHGGAKDNLHDWLVIFDTDYDGKVNVVDLAAAGPVMTDASGVLSQVNNVDATEVGYLDGVTSAIQTQFSNILDGTTSFSGLTVSANIDIGAYNITAAAFVPDTAANATGEIGFTGGAYSLFNVDDTLSITNAANVWTFNSTEDTFTFTPAVTFTAAPVFTDAPNSLVALGVNATASEINTPLDGATVTLVEFQQLEAIGATTISANQWAALGGIAETLAAAELNLLDGETDLANQAELDAVAALVDTDDEIIAIINASPGTQIGVAAGGTGASTAAAAASALGVGTEDSPQFTDLTLSGLDIFVDGTEEVISLVDVATAVNELEVTNAATGNPVILGASGGDANVDLKLVGKGTGKAKTYTELQIPVIAWTTDATVADGHFYFHIGKELAGMNLVYIHGEVITAGTTGTLNVDIRNVTQAGADVLSTNLTIDTAETGSDTAATPAVIAAAEDDMQENDVIAIDVDVIHTTASKGLIITLGFELP